MSFETLLTATGDILSKFSIRGSARIVPGHHVKSFAFNLCLVAGEVRAGFLLDAFAPFNPPELFSPLLQTLRRALPEFRHVIHIHDETSDQAFFVNTTLLRKNCEDVYSFGYEGGMPSKGVCWVDWISLETPPVLMTQEPQLRHMWDHIIGDITSNPGKSVVKIPSDLTTRREHLLIPLAAFLLEYPVGYVPLGANQTIFLNDTPLDVYECILEGSQEEHALLKFSCPQCVSQSVMRLAPDEVRKRLGDHFQPRLRAVGYPGRLKILHSQKTLPRVGL